MEPTFKIPNKVVIIDPFIHKRANLKKEEFLDRIGFVNALWNRTYELGFYFNSKGWKWKGIEHFHYIINTGDFSKQKFTPNTPFVFAIPELLFKWMKENKLKMIQDQFIFWLAGYYAFNSFKEFIPKELDTKIFKEVKLIANKYFSPSRNDKLVIDEVWDKNEYNNLYAENIKTYLRAAKEYIGTDLIEIFQDPYKNPCIKDSDHRWGLTCDLQFVYDVGYFTKIDWDIIVGNNRNIQSNSELENYEKNITDDPFQIEPNLEIFEKWKYTYEMYDLRKSNIFSLYSDDIDDCKTIVREKIPQNIKDKVWNRDGGCCVECGSKEKLEFDHIIPVSKGGSSTYRNLQLLCEKCNRKKYNKII